ncbi:uncharacterized protein N0V89_000660 [Didymosphaeria variabile]|uniref:O-methyltransferase C-terminal domain-containing protein n=1 Tax=Didymosphaeria variabile TaxID=1932322 RepID=A0A9W8XVQ7_9PLEO|nr:uncharacterized protein N0V89_000660 [Didymosphaeria variabile]KAJ4360101.1 hypothetical protein N0V89_000660 [Didymosphaeria variabile]
MFLTLAGPRASTCPLPFLPSQKFLTIRSQTPDAIALRSSEPNIPGYSLANNTKLNTFEDLGQDPDRARCFAGAMSSTSETSLDALAEHFDWPALPPGATVVDVGGAQVHASLHLAKRFPTVTSAVQDIAEVINGAQGNLPEALKDRLRLEAHDMFTPQPLQDLDVDLLRYVLHDWPDKYFVRVIENVVKDMKKGARIVLQEHVLAERGTLGMVEEMQER